MEDHGSDDYAWPGALALLCICVGVFLMRVKNSGHLGDRFMGILRKISFSLKEAFLEREEEHVCHLIVDANLLEATGSDSEDWMSNPPPNPPNTPLTVAPSSPHSGMETPEPRRVVGWADLTPPWGAPTSPGESGMDTLERYEMEHEDARSHRVEAIWREWRMAAIPEEPEE